MAYLKYIVKLNIKKITIIAIDSVLFILSTISVVNEWTTLFHHFTYNLPIILMFLLSIFRLTWDIINMTGSLKKDEALRGLIPEDNLDVIKHLEWVGPSDVELANGFECHKSYIKRDDPNKYILRSRIIDEHIRNTELCIVINKGKEAKISDYIKKNKKILLQYLRHRYFDAKQNGRDFYNESKLCLSEDIELASSEVCCHYGTYYDTYLTNRICNKDLLKNSNRKLIYDAKKVFPYELCFNEIEYKIKMQDITSSIMNNQIGVHSIGVTKDNRVVIWRQNKRAQSSNDLLVPTGSGSLDWEDIIGNDFKATICKAMQREVWEECGAKKVVNKYNDIGETKVIGFFRWLYVGGKPEFLGITKLNKRYNDLKPNEEEVFIGENHKVTTDNFLDVIGKIRENKDICIHLDANLACLQEFYLSNKHVVEEFLLSKRSD